MEATETSLEANQIPYLWIICCIFVQNLASNEVCIIIGNARGRIADGLHTENNKLKRRKHNEASANDAGVGQSVPAERESESPESNV